MPRKCGELSQFVEEILCGAKFPWKALKSQEFWQNSFVLLLHNTVQIALSQTFCITLVRPKTAVLLLFGMQDFAFMSKLSPPSLSSRSIYIPCLPILMAIYNSSIELNQTLARLQLRRWEINPLILQTFIGQFHVIDQSLLCKLWHGASDCDFSDPPPLGRDEKNAILLYSQLIPLSRSTSTFTVMPNQSTIYNLHVSHATPYKDMVWCPHITCITLKGHDMTLVPLFTDWFRKSISRNVFAA